MEGSTNILQMRIKCSMKEHTIPFRISFCRLGKEEQFAACCRHQGYDTGASEMPWLLTLRTRNLRDALRLAISAQSGTSSQTKRPPGETRWLDGRGPRWASGWWVGSTMVGCWDPWGPIDHLATAGACRAVSQPTPISILPHFHQHTSTH